MINTLFYKFAVKIIGLLPAKFLVHTFVKCPAAFATHSVTKNAGSCTGAVE